MSDRSEYVRAIDKKRNNLEVTITRAAFKILPKRYQLLEDNVQLDSAPQPEKKSVKDAAPAADEPSVTAHGSDTVENAIVTTESPQEGVTVVRRKPGPKPKQKPNA
jgi:hypothetical protein